MKKCSSVLSKQVVRGLFICIVALALLPIAGTRTVALAQQCHSFSIVASPSPGSMDDLRGIAAISPKDVWAVGSYLDTQSAHQALIEHWNGTQWKSISNPNQAGSDKQLLAVAALSSTNVWTVGTSSVGALIEQWNGKSWRIIPSPGTGGALFGVSALSSTDIWAVGSTINSHNVAFSLTEHWNGSTWSIISSPNPGKFGNGFAAVKAISSTDVWAVGDSFTTQFGYTALIEHWNGTKWSVVNSPSFGGYPYELRSISAVSQNDIWAVGSYTTAPGNISLTLTEHWNGKKWSVVPSPSPTGNDYLLGVFALSAQDVWAVGDHSSVDQNLVEHWNGSNWSAVPSAYRPRTVSGLSAVSADSPADIWTAGSDINTENYRYRTLIEHSC